MFRLLSAPSPRRSSQPTAIGCAKSGPMNWRRATRSRISAAVSALPCLVEGLEDRRLLAVTPLSFMSVFNSGLVGTQTDGDYPLHMAVGNFGGTLGPSLVTSSGRTGSIDVWLNAGGGRFATPMKLAPKGQGPITLTTGGQGDAVAVAVGDLNGDGKQDIAVATTDETGAPIEGSVVVFLGNGDGTFRAPVVYQNVAAGCTSIVIGDFAGDNRPDIVVNNTLGRSVTELYNDGAGGFNHPVVDAAGVTTQVVNVVTFGVGITPDALIATKLQTRQGILDKNVDLVVLNAGDQTVSVLFNNADGAVKRPTTFQPQYVSASGVAGTTEVLPTTAPTPRTAFSHVGTSPDMQVLTDPNSGLPDILIANDSTITVLYGNHDGSFQAPTSSLPVQTPGGVEYAFSSAVIVGDTSSNKLRNGYDLVTTNGAYNSTPTAGSNALGSAPGGTNTVLVTEFSFGDGSNQTPGPVTLGQAQLFGGFGTDPVAVAVADVNGDGLPDVLTANYGDPTSSPTVSLSVSAMLGNGGNLFQAQQLLPSANLAAGTSAAIGDFNGDGNPDIAIAQSGPITVGVGGTITYSPGSVTVILGNGDGTFQPYSHSYNVGINPGTLLVGNFNGHEDIVVANGGTATAPGTTLTLLLGNGDGTFQAPQNLTVPAGPDYLASGDLLLNGKQDLVVTSRGSLTGVVGHAVTIFTGDGAGHFSTSTLVAGQAPSSVGIGDLNGDGIPDLAVTNYLDRDLEVFFGDGAGNFTLSSAQPTIPLNSEPTQLQIGAVVDGNADGVQDIVVGSSGGVTVTIVRANVPPGFTSPDTTLLAVGVTASFTVVASGSHAPVLSESGTLPRGLIFKDNGNGTASISGTPAANTAGIYTLSILAANDVSPSASQTLTLDVISSPPSPSIITSASATFTAGSLGTFAVVTAGFAKIPSITETGTLPSGVSFVDNGNGTAALVGRPASGATGTFNFTINASSTGGQTAVEPFTITVSPSSGPPAGTFYVQQVYDTGFSGTFHALVLTDMNGDQLPDIVLAGGASFSVMENLGNRTGIFQSVGGSGVVNGNGYVVVGNLLAAGNFRNDGLPSVIMPSSNAGNATVTDVLSLPVPSIPVFTDLPNSTLATGQPGTVVITTSGSPTAKLTESGNVPGLTIASNTGGTLILSGTPTAGGNYVLSILAGNSRGTSQQTYVLTVDQAPAINSANQVSFTVGNLQNFNIIEAGFPSPVLTFSGSLPGGVTLTDNGNGSASLSGTPVAGSAGVYTLDLTATNTTSPVATQTFVLTVSSSPIFSGPTSASFRVGASASTTVTASGFPIAAITESGALPAGITFTDNGSGTASIGGTAAAGSGGTYVLTLTADNGKNPATETFTITVAQTPAITSASSTAFQTESSGSFTITTTGTPAATISLSGQLPGGLSFSDNHDGTATISGSAVSGTGGNYIVTLTAANGTLPNATQSFTIRVSEPASIMNESGAIIVTGTSGSDAASLSISNGLLNVVINSVSDSFSLGDVNSIVIVTGAGDDSISIAAGVPAVLVNGGGGNDTIVATNSAADTLGGGAMNDSVTGGGGNELLAGGAGNDTLIAGPGNDTVDGGADADSLVGGSGVDLLVGGTGPDTIIAQGMNNTLRGGKGHDSLVSAGGQNYIDGGPGIDTIVGSSSDTIVPDPLDVVLGGS